MRDFHALGVSLFLTVLAATGPLGADVKAELGFGWSLVAPAFSTSYVNQFAPPMSPLANYVGSSASQTVRLKGKIGYSMSGFFNILVGDTAGVQVLVDYFRPSLGGSNSDYNVNLSYTTTGARTYTRQDAWPDSKGDFTETTYSLNGLVRFPLSLDLAFSLSGGATEPGADRPRRADRERPQPGYDQDRPVLSQAEPDAPVQVLISGGPASSGRR
jgi:hypothetical protein